MRVHLRQILVGTIVKKAMLRATDAGSQISTARPAMQNIPDLMMSMAELDEDSVQQVRKTAESPPRVSVYDVLGVVTGCTSDRYSLIFSRLCEQFPEVRSFCSNFKFPGRGQRDTPVVDTRAIAIILATLGRAASQFRKEILENPGCADEFLDAEAILRERGCNQEQICRLAGEFGKDLFLVARSESREIPTMEKQFGPETREIKQYRRLADARFIDDVFRSFRQRPLYKRVAADDPVTMQRQQLLAEHGRGRKRRMHA